MRLILGGALLLFCNFISAQDIHFSQFNSSPLNINPALTGLFDGDFRFVGNHRNQWSAVTVPYTTTSASFDMNFKTSARSKDIIGAGLLVNSDKAGDSEYGTLQILASLSYTKELRSNGDMFVTYGMQAGVSQRSISYQNLTFDSQYNGTHFDPGLSNGENFLNSNLTFFDAAAGFNAFYAPSSKNNMNLGVALYHVNKPDQSLMEDGSVRLTPRLDIHSNAQIYLSESFDLLPGILFLNQGANSQLNIGVYAKYKIINDVMVKRAVYLGSAFRLKDNDALILCARIDYNKLNIGLSYDINFSQLSVASHNRGGVELSVIYIIQKAKPALRGKNIPCPIFM